jgi:hypothetical protein
MPDDKVVSCFITVVESVGRRPPSKDKQYQRYVTCDVWDPSYPSSPTQVRIPIEDDIVIEAGVTLIVTVSRLGV